MAALAIFAAASAAKFAGSLLDIQEGINSSIQQEGMINRQMQEIRMRSEIESQQILNRGEKIAAEQKGAFIKGGVKLEGTALDVANDTMADAAEAMHMRLMEANYELLNLALQKGALRAGRTKGAIGLQVGKAFLNAAASFGQNAAMAGAFQSPAQSTQFKIPSSANNYTYNYTPNTSGALYA